MSANLCVCCGAIIPEGRQVCPICEDKINFDGVKKTPPCAACIHAKATAFRKNLRYCCIRFGKVPATFTCKYGKPKQN